MENQAPKLRINRRLDLLEKVRETITSPGVYLMKDEAGGILYIGKAKNLRNRLLTYFQPPQHEVPRTELMLSRVGNFDVILTETEAEALILEATLVKKHKPKFNIRLKDDKAYPYLKINPSDPFPKIEWTRRVLRDGARYFGPFPSAYSARQVMQLLNETFHLRDCADNTFRHRSRPCILYQMGKCSGPCVGLIPAQGYHEAIREVIQVLEGKSEGLIRSLKKGMEEASEREEFEVAATYRDQIRNLELITETQGVDEAGSHRNRDVIGLANQGAEVHAALLRIRNGRLIAVQHYRVENSDASLPLPELVSQVLSQYYLSLKATQEKQGDSAETGVKVDFPEEVLLPTTPNDCDLLEKTLGLTLRVADGTVDEQLLNVAQANAQYALTQGQQKTQGHDLKVLEEVQKKLHLDRFPHRIECYDISNIQGQDAVASRVVFIDGAPDKNLYRRYKIRTVEGSNDFAMMKEVLGRRFSKQEESLPDLVVVDGGKGQLSQAVAILDELAVQGVGVVGLAKARVEADFQATEVKSSHERIFIPNRKNPIPLLPHTGAYRLLTHIRDEAHRFAITYHRLLRGKRNFG